MHQESKKEQIVRKLRSSDKPALSAKDLAEHLDVSVRTVNNHLPDLVEEGRIETTQIGNATAYYIPFEELPSHKKPQHSCKRCGRTTDLNDFAKVEHQTYFGNSEIETEAVDFSLLCRFCYSDHISWVHNDEAAMGEYLYVHTWDIPEKQLQEVREDPDIETCPPVDALDETERALYDLVEETGGDEAVAMKEIRDKANEEGISEDLVEPLLRTLSQRAYLFRKMKGIEFGYLAAK